MGMEANALFECYRYFNKIESESVIQIDIGYNKTIVNFIENNNLLYTRSIAIGINQYNRGHGRRIFKIKPSEAARLFQNLNLDLTSLENNVQRDYYKSLGLTRQQLRKIYDTARETVDGLIEQIMLTRKAMQVECGEITFNRALISGGGSTMTGSAPCSPPNSMSRSTPSPSWTTTRSGTSRTQFPIAFGTVLAYINRRRSSINFLKGEFIPDVASESKKIYYLSGGFAILTVIILIINFILTAVLTARSNRQYNADTHRAVQPLFPDEATSAATRSRTRKSSSRRKKPSSTPSPSWSRTAGRSSTS